jgi:hypothetical protein
MVVYVKTKETKMTKIVYKIVTLAVLVWASEGGSAWAMFASPEACCDSYAKCKEDCFQKTKKGNLSDKIHHNCVVKCEQDWIACAKSITPLKIK